MPETAETDELRWEVHPARERPAAAVAAIAVIFALSWCCYLVGQHEGWALLAVVVLCLSLARFFFPSRYGIGAAEVWADVPLSPRRVLPWEEVRRVQVGPLGAWVSAYRTPTYRDGKRGVHLLFGQHGEVVRARLQTLAGDMLSEGDPDGKNASQG